MRPNADDIDAIDRRDRVNLIDRGNGFNLDRDDGLPVDLLKTGRGRASFVAVAALPSGATVQLITDLPSHAAEGCPRGDGETRNVDAEIARRLLSEPALYSAVIDSKRPNVAAR